MGELPYTAKLVAALGGWMAHKGPIHRQLFYAIQRSIENGDLVPGMRIPSNRQLARALNISRSTVIATYEALRHHGLVSSKCGSGTWLADLPSLANSLLSEPVNEGLTCSLSSGHHEVISLSSNAERPAPELAPALHDLASTDIIDAMLDHGYHPVGHPAVRSAVAGHYTKSGLATTSDQILITNSSQQALWLITRMMQSPSSAVVVEKPASVEQLDLFRACGAHVIGIPLDNEGIRVDLLAATIATHRPELVVVTPTCSIPTGILMSARRRSELATLMANSDSLLVELNPDLGFPLHTKEPSSTPPPVAAYLPSSMVLTIGSLSQAIWGGLGVCWLRGPADVISMLARYKTRLDPGSPVIDQLLAAKLLPELPVITTRRRALLAKRRQYLESLLTEHLPRWRWRRPNGGSVLWVSMPATNSRTFARAAVKHGLEMYPGAAMDPSGDHDSYLSIPFNQPEPVITETVRRLQRTWVELHGVNNTMLGNSTDPV